MAHQVFYVQQKALIENDGQVLVLINPQGQIDFPGGRIDEEDGLDIASALKREVLEEVGLSVDIISPFMTMAKNISHGPNAGQPAIMIGYRCNYVSGEIILSDEHNEFRWVDEATYRSLDQTDEYFQILSTHFSSRQKEKN